MVINLASLFLFLFGLAAGSFLNVVVYRLNHGLSPFKGRSFCPKCKKKIPWQDNIPLLSFLFLRGKCRFCHFPISWQYPLVELATGILTPITYHLSPMTEKNLLFSIYYLLITYALIALFASDLRYQTIPDEIVYPAILISLIYAISNRQYAIPTSIVASAFFYLLHFLTHGRGMGLGDVKLAGLMGLTLGWPQIVVALYLAFLTGALTGVIMILLEKKRFGEHIPFGPFLVGATFISMFRGETILDFVAKFL